MCRRQIRDYCRQVARACYRVLDRNSISILRARANGERGIAEGRFHRIENKERYDRTFCGIEIE